MMGVWVRFLLIGFILNSLIACSGSSSSKKLEDPIPSDMSQYDTKSCEFEINDGGTADFTALTARNISTTYFSKELNVAFLNAVLTTNVPETMAFINQTGATVYKASLVDSQLCSRSLFEQATSLPVDLQELWSKASESAGSKGLILGVYFPTSESFETPSLKDKAAIVVRQNTNRWSLVHEFTHHLFMLRAKEQGYDEVKNQVLVSKAANELQDLSKRTDLPQSEIGLRMVNPYLQFSEGLDSKLVHFTLEEMAIEATLKNFHSAGKLKYVPKNSNWYISSSADRALESYDTIESIGHSLLGVLGYSRTEERQKIRDVLEKTSTRKSEIKLLKNSYPLENSQMRDDQFGIAEASPEINETCSHGNEAENILKMVRKVKKVSSVLRN